MSKIDEQQVGGDHYQSEVTPWDLQRVMKSSGNAFVDARRSDAIKYAFRVKSSDPNKLLEDMKKAAHCLQAGIDELERDLREQQEKKTVTVEKA